MLSLFYIVSGLPGGSDSKESACSARDLTSISGSGTSPGEGNGYLLQYSYLENSMDREAWWATVGGVAESRTNTFFPKSGSQLLLPWKRPQPHSPGINYIINWGQRRRRSSWQDSKGREDFWKSRYQTNFYLLSSNWPPWDRTEGQDVKKMAENLGVGRETSGQSSVSMVLE